MVKALARAFRWRKMLDKGVHATLEDLARAKGVGASYVSRVLRLTLLAPDIVEAILDGRQSAESKPSGEGRGQAAVCRFARAFQFHGRRSSRREAGLPAMRARTSASQACGSTSLSFAVVIRPYMKAALIVRGC